MAGVSEERLAINEATFRKVNEGIEAGSDDHRMAFACECGRLGCNRLLELSRPEYDAVREHPRRFFVLAGHELLDIERVIERHDRYLVVEKVGEAGAVAERTDPRRDDPG
jgi:hypothetical protein